jgi:hypothetical protein
VTAVAAGAEVLVVVHLRVVRVGGRLTVGMAKYAFEGGVILCVNVAVHAIESTVSARRDREIGRMVPGARCPVGGRVAGLTGGREPGGRVGRIGGAVVLALMTGVTGR